MEEIRQRIVNALNAIAGEVNAIAGEQFKKASERLVPILNDLRARYQKLEPREKGLVQIAGVLLGIFLLYNLIYQPLKNLHDGLETRIAAAQRELVEVHHLTEVYSRLKSDLASADKRTVPQGKDFSLFSVLEGTLSKSIGRDKIGSITPADKRISNELMEYAVNVKLTDVNLNQLVDALYEVKSLSVPVVVSNLNLTKRIQNPHSFDVDLTCSVIGRNG